MTASEPIRLVDLGNVPSIRSQSIYHAVGYALGPGTPDTILLVSPDAPYVSIGRHQDVEHEVDLGYCHEQGLSVIRREVGGGAVYLDRDQLFTQWVFQPEHLPATVQERFVIYAETLVRTYRALGIAAEYRPINDIHVAGRKIGGTGAARMDRAEVLVGSLMFDFDITTMSRVLRVPSEKFRDKVYQSLAEYMTTMRRELGQPPPREVVVSAYMESCSSVLGRPLEPGALRANELALAEELDARLASDEWLHEVGGLRRAGVRIHEDVRVGEGAYKAPGGLIRCIARVRGQRLDDVALSGDFTAVPADVPAVLADRLRGTSIQAEALRECVAAYYAEAHPEIPGVSATDWVAAILAATTTKIPA
jgi:lipoate---protein ligase